MGSPLVSIGRCQLLASREIASGDIISKCLTRGSHNGSEVWADNEHGLIYSGDISVKKKSEVNSFRFLLANYDTNTMWGEPQAKV